MISFRWGERLAKAQIRHPYRFLLVGAVLTIVAAIAASRLHIDSSYEALLPLGARELTNVDEVRAKTGGTRQLVIAIEGSTPETRVDFGRHLSKRISRLQHIQRVDVEYPVEFFEERAAWLLDDASLDEIINALERSLRLVHEDDDPRGVGLACRRVEAVLEGVQPRLGTGGVLTSRDGRNTFLVVVPSINFYDIELGRTLMGDIELLVEEADPTSLGLSVRYAGNLPIVLEQQERMTDDLRNAALIALFLGVLIIIVFTRRPLAPFLIGIPLLAGLTWSFGVAHLLYGHLNVITGFLVAVLIGLGLDFGIHLFERYRQEAEARGRGSDLEGTVVCFVSNTLSPALTSALTTAGTFFTFSFARFRGFSEFGVIAGCGIVLTLASSFLLLPPLVIVSHRFNRHRIRTPNLLTRLDGLRPPRTLAAWVVGAFGLCVVVGLTQMTSITYHNDFRRLRGYSEATEFTEYVDENLGIGFNPAVIVVKSLEEVVRVEAIVRARAEEIERGEEGVRSKRVLSFADLLPANVGQRATQLQRLERLLEDPVLDRIINDGVEGPERAERLALGRRMVKRRPWTIDEIPEVFRRRFQTRDGTQLLVYVWPEERNDTDTQAIAWEHELNELGQRFRASGIDAQIADETLITAWVHRLVSDDCPRLLALASLVVFLFLVIDRRSLKQALLLSTALAVGVLSFVAALVALGLEFNLFNMIIVPSIIGIGIDNIVHVYHRYKREGAGSMYKVIRKTGFAAMLASLTTAVGFGSSLVSHHVGLRSLGLVAVLGIGATLASAVLFFPALLTVLEGVNEDGRSNRSLSRTR